MQPARFRQADFLLVEISNAKVHVRGRRAGSFPEQQLVIEPTYGVGIRAKKDVSFAWSDEVLLWATVS